MMATPRALEMASEKHSELREERSRRCTSEAWHWGPSRVSAKLLRGPGNEFVRVRRVGFKGVRVRSRRSIVCLDLEKL